MKPTRTCPLCGKSTNEIHLGSHSDRATGITYELYECTHCKGQAWEPLKNPGAHWYEHDERYSDRNKSPILNPNWNHKKVISFLAPKTGSVLDVGCGVGNFLAWANRNGWQTTGIDFDHDAVEAGKKTFGLSNLFVSDLKQFSNAHLDSRFDLITFFDVLEHIDNHKEFMALVRGLLKEDGYIAMSMPYRGHAEWLMSADVPPRHLTKWNREALKNFLEQEGFEISYLKRTPASIPFIIIKLRFRFGRKFSIGLVHKVKNKGSLSSSNHKSWKVHAAHLIAKIKDSVLFGIPATCIWLVLLSTRKRYIGLFAIARKKETAH